MESWSRDHPASEEGGSQYYQHVPYVLEAVYILRLAFYVLFLSAISRAPLRGEEVLW